ncbi:MAG: hypothetical protein GY812_02345 [Actinomycetia bacterium]|nr:hypothetical protein [Actinomycetes bacterium]
MMPRSDPPPDLPAYLIEVGRDGALWRGVMTLRGARRSLTAEPHTLGTLLDLAARAILEAER